MRKSTKSAVAITLAIAGAIASPFSSNAAALDLRGGGSHLQKSGVIAAYEPHSAAVNPARNELKGRVVKVSDGDTITILDAGNNQHKIRLNGIDAPEKSQAFGQKSRVHLSSLVSGKNVTVVYKSKDRYGRVLGTVFADSLNVNLEMLRGGYAWHYKRYDSTPAFAAAELKARNERRGLWVDANPTNPEDFRHRGKSSVFKSSARKEYRAGSAKANRRVAAPVTEDCPDTATGLTAIQINVTIAIANIIAKRADSHVKKMKVALAESAAGDREF